MLPADKEQGKAITAVQHVAEEAKGLKPKDRQYLMSCQHIIPEKKLRSYSERQSQLMNGHALDSMLAFLGFSSRWR
jgi:hypothetical protein